ncbi:MAG: hypothetical protein M3N33_01250 [Actinomycetota bacterium]|nr:hypothetical protein [Actinomycetota bacterium]
MTQHQQGSGDDDTVTPRTDRVADARGEHEPDRTSAQQATVNEEAAFESGEENPS